MNERTKQIGTFRTILQPQIRRRLADVETNKMFKKKNRKRKKDYTCMREGTGELV